MVALVNLHAFLLCVKRDNHPQGSHKLPFVIALKKGNGRRRIAIAVALEDLSGSLGKFKKQFS
ncbi:MAG: hypothetical protein MZV63_16225 [Marinilabiliales bacterium]|nr:hypothetical protein [Marinilabiliales bacterium]